MQVFAPSYRFPSPLLNPLLAILLLIRIYVQHWSLFWTVSRSVFFWPVWPTRLWFSITNVEACQTADVNLLWAPVVAKMEEPGGAEMTDCWVIAVDFTTQIQPYSRCVALLMLFCWACIWWCVYAAGEGWAVCCGVLHVVNCQHSNVFLKVESKKKTKEAIQDC